MALLHVNFFSDVLGMCMNMDVILPQQTKNQIGMKGTRKDGKIPTLYLLHGMSDDHTIWQRRTSIERYVSEMGIAVIMPTTHLGWYTNTTYGLNYWTFISEELPMICRSFFANLSERREDTFVAGLSMGGYGAFKLALGASDTFGAAASLSGALNARRRETDSHARTQRTFWEGIFGPLDQIKGSSNDLMTLAEQLIQSGKPLPKLFMWCGTEDFLLEENEMMYQYFKEMGVDVTYTKGPGGHQWECWDEQIQNILKWLPIRSEKHE